MPFAGKRSKEKAWSGPIYLALLLAGHVGVCRLSKDSHAHKNVPQSPSRRNASEGGQSLAKVRLHRAANVSAHLALWVDLAAPLFPEVHPQVVALRTQRGRLERRINLTPPPSIFPARAAGRNTAHNLVCRRLRLRNRPALQ